MSRKLEITVETSQCGYRVFSPLYDIVFGASLHHGRKLAIRALACSPGDRILEVGIGSGLSLPLYPEGSQVAGIDISLEMLKIASVRARKRRPWPATALLKMDAATMAFADASFDKAVVLYAMAGLPDPVRAMNEIERVCKPGATIAIVNHFLSHRPASRVCDALLSPLYRLLRYRADLDMHEFIAQARLKVIEVLPANLFGYSTVLVCQNAGVP